MWVQPNKHFKGVFMKSIVIATLLAASSFAMAAKSYQVTGPVLEVTDSTITVDKKGEKFEIDRAAGMGGDVKKGAKVTVKYTMTASDIEVKSEGAAKKEKKAKK
jgi:predicted RecB family endonuclease